MERYYPDAGEVLPSPEMERACRESWELFRSERKYLPHWEKMPTTNRREWRLVIEAALRSVQDDRDYTATEILPIPG